MAKLNIQLNNKDGNVWDISDMVTDATWKTVRNGKAGTLNLTMLRNAPFQSRDFRYRNGDIIQVAMGDQALFKGYIFEVESGRDDTVKLTAYDQLRYLMANHSYAFEGVTAADVIRQIAHDFALKTGTLEDTGYRMDVVQDNKKLMDIILYALTHTLIQTGNIYVFYDDYGKLTLRNVENMALNLVIGDGSLLHDFRMSASIDKDTYNRVIIVHDDQQAGERKVYPDQDAESIGRWGLLQLFQVSGGNQNPAQIREQVKLLMRHKNREHRTLTLNALGDVRVRAGHYVYVKMDEWGLDQYVLVDECQHRFNGSEHTMSLKVRMG